MIKGKKTILTVWGIAFALTLFLLLIIPEQITGITIVALVFDCIGYISQLFLWTKLTQGEHSTKDVFENTPAAFVTCAYLAILFLLSILCGLLPNMFSLKTEVIVNVIIMVGAWLLLVGLLAAKGHIKHVDSRQKDHHVEL